VRQADDKAPPPAASVIVPAYNAAGTIEGCICALKSQTVAPENYEIIVVDDGSTDNTAELAETAGARVVRQTRGRPAAARNRGIDAANAQIVCFTDADCFPMPDWLEALLVPFADADVAGCKGIYATEQSSLTARFVQLEYEDKYDLLRGQSQIDFIDTYSAAYRRDILTANGSFDETFPYLEDQELSFRLASRGYNLVFQPDAIVKHLHADSVWDYFRKKYIIGYWKAQVVRRFPERGIRDSHTPQVIKVQMALMAMMLVAAASSLVFGPGRLIFLALAVVFLVTTLPFVRKAWPKDRSVAMISPLLLAERALALGLGYGLGTVLPGPKVGGGEASIGGFQYVAKRALDLVGGVVGVAVACFVGPFIAAAIKLDSPGPVLYSQERVGQGGKLFTIYKFRSMDANAEAEPIELQTQDPSSSLVLKLVDDPRRTRVGKFLRRWSLDELPQFWNVLRGEMSLVGPRPEEARVVALYSDWHRRRLAVKPGLSGPMQINGRADLNLDSRVRLEIEYIENYSLWRDLTIIAQTIPAVVRGRGAH
jgi:lipopolysaccharide/colanic/teichoic acid biosynthesis glycosyltransferase/glycosyltransferase involved in cell wall biosynthesis